MDGLMLLAERGAGEPVTVSEVHARTSRATSSVRVAQVLDDLQLNIVSIFRPIVSDEQHPSLLLTLDRCTYRQRAGGAPQPNGPVLTLAGHAIPPAVFLLPANRPGHGLRVGLQPSPGSQSAHRPAATGRRSCTMPARQPPLGSQRRVQ
jgi:hypothetical protein